MFCSFFNFITSLLPLLNLVPLTNIICSLENVLINIDCPNLKTLKQLEFKVKQTVNTDLYLFDSKSNCYDKFCKINDSPSKKSKLQYKKQIAILIHGFSRNYNEKWMYRAAEELSKKNISVIALDWRIQYTFNECSLNKNTFWYKSAAANVEAVANRTAKHLTKIAKIIGKWDHVHIIGHSLGAHIAGQIGRNLKNSEYNITVDRITGLDPALPGFRDKSTLRLRKSHALFVDVIHTNSAPEDDYSLGIYKPLGHIDFYPNNGNQVNECVHYIMKPAPDAFREALNGISEVVIGDTVPNLLFNLAKKRNDLMCNHYKATEYFVASLNLNDRCNLTAHPMKNEKCQDVEMGINASNVKYRECRGQYSISHGRMDDLWRRSCVKTLNEIGVLT